MNDVDGNVNIPVAVLIRGNDEGDGLAADDDVDGVTAGESGGCDTYEQRYD
jgi:hypothetical protein